MTGIFYLNTHSLKTDRWSPARWPCSRYCWARAPSCGRGRTRRARRGGRAPRARPGVPRPGSARAAASPRTRRQYCGGHCQGVVIWNNAASTSPQIVGLEVIAQLVEAIEPVIGSPDHHGDSGAEEEPPDGLDDALDEDEEVEEHQSQGEQQRLCPCHRHLPSNNSLHSATLHYRISVIFQHSVGQECSSSLGQFTQTIKPLLDFASLSTLNSSTDIFRYTEQLATDRTASKLPIYLKVQCKL